MEFNVRAVPTGYDDHSYYMGNRDDIQKRKRDYRHNNSKWTTDTVYLTRDIVAWDGEGVTSGVDNVHRYIMLAVKTSGYSDYLGNTSGIGTSQALDLILAAGEANPGALHVIYGGSYDFNMIMRD